MLKLNLDLWILIICILISSLCLITTFFLIFNKKSLLSHPAKSSTDNHAQNYFEDEVAFQVTCQQLDMLLLNTISEIEKQRLFLQRYIAKKEQSSNLFSQENNDISDYTKQIVQKEMEQKLSGEKDHQKDNFRQTKNLTFSYDIISKLFQSGLTSKQIAEKTKIPQAEIDLYIKLHLNKDQNSKNPASMLHLSV